MITVKNLDEISSSAGANIHSTSVLNFEDLKVSTSAGSNTTLEVFSKKLKIKSSSGSNAIIQGKAYDVELDASSGSNIKAGSLEATRCYAEASSGANVKIEVITNFKGHASSGGNVFYSGNPEKIDISNSSGGNVIKK